jgi:hypothetical protein
MLERGTCPLVIFALAISAIRRLPMEMIRRQSSTTFTVKGLALDPKLAIAGRTGLQLLDYIDRLAKYTLAQFFECDWDLPCC